MDGGGTVLLKATDESGVPTAFNFGAPERSIDRVVRLRTDVAVLGETVGVGQTTIRGGWIPFLGVTRNRTTIEGNRIDTVQSSAVLVIRGSGTVDITRNHIRSGPGDPGEETFGNGITVVGSDGARHRIRQNTLLLENPQADGIILLGFDFLGEIDGAVVDGNRVHMRETNFGAITLVGGVSRSLVSNNTITGEGPVGHRDPMGPTIRDAQRTKHEFIAEHGGGTTPEE